MIVTRGLRIRETVDERADDCRASNWPYLTVASRLEVSTMEPDSI